MGTVKSSVQDLADGLVSLQRVYDDFESRTWPADPVPTELEAAGIHDTPLPGPNSFDWVDLNPGLTGHEREMLRQAHDRAVARDR